MKNLLTPKLDLVFKRLFATAPDILLDLLNAVLHLPEQQVIRSLEVKNPQILPSEITEKYIILDILAVDNKGRQYDIEMQAQKYACYPERAVFYLSRMYSSQLDAGEQYERLKPVIGIHFLNYEEFPKHADFHFHFELRDIRYPELRLTDDFALHIFELPKLQRRKESEQWGDPALAWLHFLNHAHEEEDKAMRTQYQNPAIEKAFNMLETLSADEEIRRLAEMREKALRNKVSELFAAKEEGREEGFKKGELVGEIRMLQRIAKRQISSQEVLATKSMSELEQILQEMETALN